MIPFSFASPKVNWKLRYIQLTITLKLSVYDPAISHILPPIWSNLPSRQSTHVQIDRLIDPILDPFVYFSIKSTSQLIN